MVSIKKKMEKQRQDFEDWVIAVQNSNLLVIVEGKKDKAALEMLGITRIITLSKQPLFAVIETVAATEKEIIILTDFDKKGKELYGKLKKYAEHVGLKVNHGFREWLQKNTKYSHVEGIKASEE